MGPDSDTDSKTVRSRRDRRGHSRISADHRKCWYCSCLRRPCVGCTTVTLPHRASSLLGCATPHCIPAHPHSPLPAACKSRAPVSASPRPRRPPAAADVRPVLLSTSSSSLRSSNADRDVASAGPGLRCDAQRVKGTPTARAFARCLPRFSPWQASPPTVAATCPLAVSVARLGSGAPALASWDYRELPRDVVCGHIRGGVCCVTYQHIPSA